MFCFFIKYATATEVSTLSLHDALPIYLGRRSGFFTRRQGAGLHQRRRRGEADGDQRSEEHTSELQSLTNLVCRLLLEKKKTCSSKKGLVSVSLEAAATVSSVC